MKRRFLVGLAFLIVLLTLSTVYLIISVAPKISKAKSILSVNVTGLRVQDITRAQQYLKEASGILHGIPAQVLRFVPVERQNIDAVRSGVDGTLPVLSTARALRSRLTVLQHGGLVDSGQVSLTAIRGLQHLLADAASSVNSLVESLQSRRSGWLIPTIWTGLNGSLNRARSLQAITSSGSRIAQLAPRLLGASGPRRYLVLLVNNAEVRPSGGIVSGIGLLTVTAGHLKLGSFHYYTDLAQPPYKRVAAPADFRRQYGRFKADTTRWVNVTMSPDTEEVATVASRLYKVTAGKTTDGAIIIDPHGIASLLPPDTRVRVPGTDTEVTPSDLPRYVYSTAYSQLGGHTELRHGTLINLGEAAFEGLVSSHFGTKDELAKAASALGGGHVRVVSFRPEEEKVLRAAGVTGALASNTEDKLYVTETNFNGTKLDFWSHNSIEHTCEIHADGVTPCETSIELENKAPLGLSSYVAGDRPYGQRESLINVYLPPHAVLQRVQRDGRPATFTQQQVGDLTNVGISARVPRGERVKLVIDYILPRSSDGYSIQITPQPLTHDLNFKVTLLLPTGWVASGTSTHGKVENGVYERSGHLGRPETIRITPSRTKGISTLWKKLVNFWNNPVF